MRSRTESVPMEEHMSVVRDFLDRGLLQRYLEIDRAVPGPRQELEALTAEWFTTPEFRAVQEEVVRICGDEATADFLTRTSVSAGVTWIRGGRKEPLNVRAVARVTWNRRHIGNFGDVLECAQLERSLVDEEE